MTLHCPYCGEVQLIDRGLSKLTDSLKERTYALLCGGKSQRKPHPPTIVFMEVTSTYNDKDVKLASVTIFQMQLKLGVYDNYRQYIKVRTGNKVGQPGTPRKNKDDPSIAPFKCLECGLKGERNFSASHLQGRRPSQWRVAYDCNNASHMPITYFAKRIVIARNGRTANFPFDVETLRMLTESWEAWMLDYWDPGKVLERRQVAALGRAKK